MAECEHVRKLISGYLDDELTQQEQQQLLRHLESCEACARIRNELRQVQQDIGQLRYPEPETEQLARIMQDPGAAWLRGFGWLALIAGAAFLAVVWLVVVLVEADTPWFMKVILVLMGAGGAALLFSVLRQRLIDRKSDKYRRVQL